MKAWVIGEIREHGRRRNRATGALRYFLRLQIAHVCEAMSVIQEIERSDRLRAYVRATDRQTQQSYDALLKIKRNKPFKLMKLIRNKVGFHYDPVWGRRGYQEDRRQAP